MGQTARTEKEIGKKDTILLLIAFLMAVTGVVMVASSSVAIAEQQTGFTTYYLFKQVVYLGIGLIFATVVSQIPLAFWAQADRMLLCFGLLLLALVLVPGIGHEVNGSRRWLQFGPIGFQVSEFIKLAVVLFIAGFISRYEVAQLDLFNGFIKPLAVVAICAMMLLLEPDFGATVIILSTSLGMLFLAGVRLRHFFSAILVAAVLLTVLIVTSPYRFERLTGFINPWADKYNTGYQLTQALIAFGRGEWLGVGLGGSIQKLFYLPEAHTDFMFAVIAEELGLFGCVYIILLFALFAIKGFQIGRNAILAGNLFAGFLGIGLTLWFTLQAFISMGVNTGLLPTKGLTLPLISYGGSSLVISCIVVALLRRIAFEYGEPIEKTTHRHRVYG